MPSTFNAEGKNFLEIAIAKAQAATACGRINKTIKARSDKLGYQFFSCLVKEFVGSCYICQSTKYLQRRHIRYITSLHVPVRLWSDITMDFLKLSPVFTKCSVLYPNILLDEDHIVCISRLWTIVNRQLGLKILIPVSYNFSAEQCAASFDTHVVPTIGYPYCIVFDQNTLFMSLHFQSWAPSKGIKLEPSITYHSQMDR